MKEIRLLIILALVISAEYGVAQSVTPYLERTLTISLKNERLDIALKKMAQQGGFSFSYSPSILDASRTISYNFTNKTIREILDQIFNGSLEYKVRSKHIILTKSTKASNAQNEKTLAGYVVDEATGERLKNVSVYDPVTLTSAVTDSYGYFEIRVTKPSTDIQLSVNKQSYSDTTIAVSSENKRLINIPIHIDKRKIVAIADSVSRKIVRFWRTKVLHPQLPNLLNIEDTLTREMQFSFLPFIGTNHKLSGNVINDFSFNLIGGYSLGVKKFELGGGFNIDRGAVEGGQVAGLFNVVGGTFRGVQVAGLFNANYGITRGVQIAGLANVNWNSSAYGSVAGLINFTRLQSKGVHLAGLGNFTLGEQKGPHIAGLFNFTSSDAEFFQLAGGINFTVGNFVGAQVSGLMNFTGENSTGTQIGLINFTGNKITGTQIGGLLNYATKVRGSQIGFINISDSIRGVPVGVLSFVMHGYHKIEVSADEIFYTNVALRTGVRQFYNIFTAGAKPESFKEDSTFWTLGYGVGTAPKLNRWLSLNLDVTTNKIMHERSFRSWNLLHKLYVGFDLHMSKNVSLTFGATLNAYLTQLPYDGYANLPTDYQPAIVYEKTYDNDLNLKMWLGGKVGLRFL